MAHDFHLAADFSGLIHDAHRCFFDRDVQTCIMFHAALLHLMRVAAPTQTTFTISLKRSAATLAAGRASQPNTPSKHLAIRFTSRFLSKENPKSSKLPRRQSGDMAGG